jgi:hypothetical protein
MMKQVARLLLEQPFPIEDSLIQNKTLAIKEIQSERAILFRWRFRVCKSCSTDFDIESEGMFYKCEECL